MEIAANVVDLCNDVIDEEVTGKLKIKVDVLFVLVIEKQNSYWENEQVQEKVKILSNL